MNLQLIDLEAHTLKKQEYASFGPATKCGERLIPQIILNFFVFLNNRLLGDHYQVAQNKDFLDFLRYVFIINVHIEILHSEVADLEPKMS